MILFIIKDTGFHLKRVQVKEKNELSLTFLLKIGNKPIKFLKIIHIPSIMKIIHIPSIIKDTGFHLKKVQVKEKIILDFSKTGKNR